MKKKIGGDSGSAEVVTSLLDGYSLLESFTYYQSCRGRGLNEKLFSNLMHDISLKTG